jgi:hypothetical protein
VILGGSVSLELLQEAGMKRLLAVAATLVSLATLSARAETITFETDGGLVFVRAYDQLGTAIVEFIGEPGAMYQCIVMDASGTPLATGVVFADVGQALFQGVSAAAIKNFACRKTM